MKVKSSTPYCGCRLVTYTTGHIAYIYPKYIVNVFTDGVASWVADSKHRDVKAARSRRQQIERATQGRIKGLYSISVYPKHR